MARTFDGANSKIQGTFTNAQKGLTTVTTYQVIKRNAGGGEAGYGGIWTLEDGSANRRYLFANDNGDAGWGLVYRANFSGGDYNWSCPYPGDTNWHVYIITHDGTSNAPTIYKDGVSQTITARTTGSGSSNNNETTYIIGNRSNQTETWDGGIAELARWNRILTAEEIALLSGWRSPAFVPSGLVFYEPIKGAFSPEIELIGDASGTVTSAAQLTHPDIIYPTKLPNKLRPRIFAPGLAR